MCHLLYLFIRFFPIPPCLLFLCLCCTMKQRNEERKISVSIRAAVLFNMTARYALKARRACPVHFDVRMKHKPRPDSNKLQLKMNKKTFLSHHWCATDIDIHMCTRCGFLSDVYAAVTVPQKNLFVWKLRRKSYFTKNSKS